MKQLLDIALGDVPFRRSTAPHCLSACMHLQQPAIGTDLQPRAALCQSIDLGKHHAMYNPLRNGLYKLFGHDHVDCYLDKTMAEQRTLENACMHTLNVQAGNLTPEANSGMAVLTSAYDLTEKTAAWWNDGMSLRMRLPRS
eukprot:TRINITY_DN12241_c0_g1_i1.p2 TRINITY_DN12241_c0_g1~~TRINITY_DN12241_c0_g1_i1.p2  ORF type:complete len:141 (+),score=24.76 TRINITY_DN12241_c0_g1_i1:880-1302(+)